LAATVTDTLLVTTTVVIVNVALVAPAGTVTVTGTDPAVPVMDRLTTEPPAGAATARVTVPVTVFPPTTDSDDSESPFRMAGFMVIVAELVAVPTAAVIVAEVAAATNGVVTVKVAES